MHTQRINSNQETNAVIEAAWAHSVTECFVELDILFFLSPNIEACMLNVEKIVPCFMAVVEILQKHETWQGQTVPHTVESKHIKQLHAYLEKWAY